MEAFLKIRFGKQNIYVSTKSLPAKPWQERYLAVFAGWQRLVPRTWRVSNGNLRSSSAWPTISLGFIYNGGKLFLYLLLNHHPSQLWQLWPLWPLGGYKPRSTSDG